MSSKKPDEPAGLRVALLVEGSRTGTRNRQGDDYLTVIWRDHLRACLNLREFSRIIGIDKKHLVALDPAKPKMSGAGEPLDDRIKRELDVEPFEAAVIAFDLQPPWDTAADACRWTECLNVYRHLAGRDRLPEPWRGWVCARAEEMAARPNPSTRARLPVLEPGAILLVCMESIFESLLVADERAIKEALGVVGVRMKKWPALWDSAAARPDWDLLQPALVAVRQLKPPPACVRQVGGDMKTNKHGWDSFLLERLSASATGLARIRGHMIARRLVEVAGERSNRERSR